ncbi:hypothetical protein CKM354_000177000 [Cercospora kikuchii]|uniref:Uncharacterized protein n=1 Tax=Cercospora kikuchii TaxID=84275 RepID=A0A9P3C8W0_9PEZI|nr:uncharacterized protein CKM354_000177000 [Cercospora kikuchii]GIZ38351.1 hypothetical protein CKM354_000177000 [Cercospora kikuchii]
MPRRLFPRIVGEDANNYLLTTTNYEDCKEASVKWIPKDQAERHIIPAWEILSSSAVQRLRSVQGKSYEPYTGVDRVELHFGGGALFMYIDINPPGGAMLREIRKADKCTVWMVEPFVSGPRPRMKEKLAAAATNSTFRAIAPAPMTSAPPPAMAPTMSPVTSPNAYDRKSNFTGAMPPNQFLASSPLTSSPPKKELQGKMSPIDSPQAQYSDGKMECERTSLPPPMIPEATPGLLEEPASQALPIRASSPTPGIPLTQHITLPCEEQTGHGLDHDNGFFCGGIWHDDIQLGFITCKVCVGTAMFQAMLDGNNDIIEHGANVPICIPCAKVCVEVEHSKMGCFCLEEKCTHCFLHAVDDMKALRDAIEPGTNYGELCCKCYQPIIGLPKASKCVLCCGISFVVTA